MRTRYVLLAAAALAWPLAGQAQEAPAVSAAKAHFQSTSRVAAADLAELSVADSYLDRRSGATHVYLSQRHNGVDIYGTMTAAAVRDGQVFASGDAFQTDLAARANGATPNVAPEAAAMMAQAHAQALTQALVSGMERTVFTDNAAQDAQPIDATVAYRTVGEPQLVYQTTAGDALRLAWAVELQGDGGPSGQQLWNIRVDAQNGVILVADDLLTYDSHGPAPERTDFAPTRTQSLPSIGQLTGSYRVVPIPAESPNHGAFELVANPDDPDASPFGWHDTNGAAGSETTNTSGANVSAYLDTDDNNSPDANSQPDGGAGLVFDFAFDPTQDAPASPEASVVSLFYWNNIVHDVLWQYGFDEASGNFQTNNYGRGGSQNDAVRAESLDGLITCNNPAGCDSNANFGTPSDGAAPRMQMYQWSGVPTFTATAPADVAGEYDTSGAQFGSDQSVSSEVAFAADPEGGPGTACTAEEVDNAGDLAGNIAFISRGDCDFVQKARLAQTLGAVAVVVYNCPVGADGCAATSTALVTMACPEGTSCDDVTIPAAFVSAATAETIEGASATVTASIGVPPSRDGSYDAGIMAHEYGHGVSNRLTGGRFATGCLGNQEQMGEGWSDYIGLMLTMKSTDTAVQPRGVGTYSSYQETDGSGIRPAPYSTDFAVNPATYDDVLGAPNNGISIPHGVGYVWSSMLWDMTWAMIAEDGFGDIYDADGGMGNQKALQIVMQAMKLQPCSPGFVDGRDAIFAADELLYGRANSDVIASAFAARGLGLNADQGQSSSVADGTSDFTAFPPFIVASETDAAGRVTELAVSGQNPFRSETSLTLSVGTSQDVTVDMVDLLGRRVATLFTGEMSADSAKRLAVSADGLPSGVYVVRAMGETFSLTERITITR